jgi:Zn-dependent protease with chaperone function
MQIRTEGSASVRSGGWGPAAERRYCGRPKTREMDAGWIPLIVTVSALMPAALALWWNRRLAAIVEDPAFPERLLASRGRSAAASFCAVVLIGALGARHLVWGLPLLVVARTAAAFPLRRVLYQETWSLGVYLSSFLRLMGAFFGFWVLLAGTPALIVLAGASGWIVALALAVLLLLLNHGYADVVLAVLAAKPIADASLIARFEGLLERAGLSRVKLLYVDFRGGVFANAVALPSLRTPAVAVSSTLVERLDQDEVVAILAHEIAHIEHYSPRRLLRAGAAVAALVVLACMLPVALRLYYPSMSSVVGYIFPAVVVVSMALQAQQRQQHETESDLRAVALTDDPDALIRALVKLHAISLMPRRWDTDFEQHASHPSLARRIQAILDRAGKAPAPLAQHLTFPGEEDGVSVTFEADRLVLNEQGDASHVLSYRGLSSLRVDARMNSVPKLVAVDNRRRRWEMAVRTGDVIAIQATLDAVDSKLGKASSPSKAPEAPTRLLALVAAALSLTIGQVVAAMIAASVALVKSGPPMVAAAAGALVAAAGLSWREEPLFDGAVRAWGSGVLVAVAAVLLVAAWRSRNEEERGWPHAMTVLTAIAVASLGALSLSSGSALDLHQGAREWSAAVVAPAALAAALAFNRSRARRAWALVPAAAALAVASVGSTAFLDRFVDDPLLVQAPVIEVRTLDAPALAEHTLPSMVVTLALSPSAGHVAFSTADGETTTIKVGPVQGPWTPFEAHQALFVSEARVLLLDRGRGGSVLSLVDAEAPQRIIWSRRVPLQATDLQVVQQGAHWQMLGWDEDGRIAVALGDTGDAGDTALWSESWESPAEADQVQPISAADGRVMAIETDYSAFGLTDRSFWWLALLAGSSFRPTARFWIVDTDGAATLMTSRLEVTCRSGALNPAHADCTAFDGTRTRFVTLTPGDDRPTPVATLDGRLFSVGSPASAWTAGWWRGDLVAINPSTRVAVKIPFDAADARPSMLAVGAHTLGAIHVSNGTATLRLYALE